MRIVVLGWGSLCWERRRLRIRGDWHSDGPRLPIEFARVSKSRQGALTLVLLPRSRRVQVLWADMSLTSVDEAIENLVQQEQVPNSESIGCVDLYEPNNNNCQTLRSALPVIKKWAKRKQFDAVIWTDLPTNFLERTGTKFNADNVVAYLASLDNDGGVRAEEYVRRAPHQIRTRMRNTIENRLGWKQLSDNI